MVVEPELAAAVVGIVPNIIGKYFVPPKLLDNMVYGKGGPNETFPVVPVARKIKSVFGVFDGARVTFRELPVKETPFITVNGAFVSAMLSYCICRNGATAAAEVCSVSVPTVAGGAVIPSSVKYTK